MIKLEERIRETGTDNDKLNDPTGTEFEFQVLEIVIPADFIKKDKEEGYDPETLKLLYSVSDSEPA